MKHSWRKKEEEENAMDRGKCCRKIISERNHGTLVQELLSKSFKQGFIKKSIVSFYEYS